MAHSRPTLADVAGAAGVSVSTASLAFSGAGPIAAETREVFRQLGLAVNQGGLSLRDIAAVTVYLSDLADMPAMNRTFTEIFPTDPPARVTIQVQPQGKERIRVGLVAAR